MCVGLLKERDLIKAAAHGIGNVLLVVGSRTGRDGIHGASFASEELTHESEQRRPQVQVGDPFTEKLLLEASLALIASGHIVAIQDMGAAGLTSSSAEMAAKGGVGVEIDLSLVPTREPGMTPYESLLSAFATTSIRSCDSGRRISYGVIAGSRVGASGRSISPPTPPFAAISADDDVRPAAPMSWIATMWPDAISSRLASSSSFSVNGSPTCTWGRRRSDSCVSSSDANAAP